MKKNTIQDSMRSAGYAKERMKLLLLSERMDCSLPMMNMLRNDLIHTLKKYMPIEEAKVTIQISQEPPVLHAEIPILPKQRETTQTAPAPKKDPLLP